MAGRKLPEKSRSPGLTDQRCQVAVILVDTINDFEFDGATPLLNNARAIAPKIARLSKRARALGVPVIYVNDNFGRWRSDFHALVRHCLRRRAPGREFVARLQPDRLDYFVLKPQNSGFFSTALETLLRHLGAEILILTGLTTDNCVLYTAHDAYLRKFRLFVPSDCTAAMTTALHRQALSLIASTTKADTGPSAKIPLEKLCRA